MIQKLTIVNYLKEALEIPLFQSLNETGLLIKNITGLGPPKADINTTEVITNDGSIFNTARTHQRNIVLTFKYLATKTSSIEQARLSTYRYFPIKKKVTLIFETDHRSAEISGYVESNEATIFSKESGCVISIICPEPFLYLYGSGGIQVHVFYGVNKNFEFPFENDSDIPQFTTNPSMYDKVTSSYMYKPRLEFGLVQELREQNIFYEGDSDVGMTIIMHALGEVGDVIIYNTHTREKMQLYEEKLAKLTGSGIIKGDDIIIRTSKGEKGIELYREGETINIINALDRGTNWLRLTKGDNFIAYSTTRGGQNLEFRIENRVIYEGV